MTFEDMKMICKEATPGPWEFVHVFAYENILRADLNREDAPAIGKMRYQNDGLFVGTFNPELVGKLLAIAEAARDLITTDEDDIISNEGAMDFGPLEQALADLERV